MKYTETEHSPQWVPGDICRIEEWAPSGEWVLCDFDYRIDYIGKSHVIATTVGTPREVERVFKEVRLIPLKTERERVIEAADALLSEAIESDQPMAEALYDAGMLVMPEGEK